ncbi:MAG TPA: hypothetical protein VGE55_09075 [Limnobacter sp.]|uniref:hypothetical protein n=1 Tax=Limnobacter sp. TaxID=2003368 RepID=UPI002ED9F104
MMDVPIESALKEARERLDGEVINWMNQCKLAYAKCDVEPMKTAATALYQQLETTARSLKPLGVDGSSLSGDSVHEERLTQLMKVEFAAAMQRAPQELLNELGRVPQYQALDKQMDADLERGRVFIQFGLNQFFW